MTAYDADTWPRTTHEIKYAALTGQRHFLLHFNPKRKRESRP